MEISEDVVNKTIRSGKEFTVWFFRRLMQCITYEQGRIYQ